MITGGVCSFRIRAKKMDDWQGNERRLRYITDYLLEIIIETDGSGIIKFASPSNTPLFSYNPQELIGISIYNL